MSNLARLLNAKTSPANPANSANQHDGISRISGISSGGDSAQQPEMSDAELAMDARRQRVLRLLERAPSERRYVFENHYIGDCVIVALAVRDVATCEFVIPKAKFDAFAFLVFIQAQDRVH